MLCACIGVLAASVCCLWKFSYLYTYARALSVYILHFNKTLKNLIEGLRFANIMPFVFKLFKMVLVSSLYWRLF